MPTNRDYFGADALQAAIDGTHVCMYYVPTDDTMALIAIFEAQDPFEGIEAWLNMEVDLTQVRCLYSLEDLTNDSLLINC